MQGRGSAITNFWRLCGAVCLLALTACASPNRRVEADKVSVFALDADAIKSMRVVLVPVRDTTLMTAYRESVAGWNTSLFDERFGRRLAANFEANGVQTAFRGASGLDAGSSVAAPDYVMLITMTKFSYVTRNGLQDAPANYNVRVSLYRPGTNVALLSYEDVMIRGFVGTHDDVPDRFTYSFFNLLKDRGRWTADKVKVAN